MRTWLLQVWWAYCMTQFLENNCWVLWWSAGKNKNSSSRWWHFVTATPAIVVGVGAGWSRHAIIIGIFYASLNVEWHQTFQMLIFYTTYKFLSNFLCNWHELYYSPTFFRLPLSTEPIHWYLTRILTFLSEQQAPFSTMFAWELSIKWYDHSIVTYKFQYLWRVWTSLVQGCDCDSCM